MGKGLGRGLWKKGGTWMRFAVCDDNAADRRQLLSMLQQYCGNHRVQAEIQPFADGRALLDAFAPGKYQILFLDIYMPALTGMEAAKAIREKDTGCQLVFTTTSEDHALESYGVYAAGYLLKPYTQGQLDETVDWCLDNISPLAQAIEITYERERVQVLLGEIQYIEVFGRESIFHTTSRTYTTNRSLVELEQELPKDFLRCHRSYIVNMNYIANMTTGDFILQNGCHVPISATMRAKAKQSFCDWMFQKVREGI